MNRKNEKHGMIDAPEYVAWSGMIDRCHNPKNRRFRSYGGRGIIVHDPWRTSFKAFLSEVGLRPSRLHSLDRIDNERNYEPGNVRWASPKQQAANRRTTRAITINGETASVSEWARRTGIKRNTLDHRLARNWPTAELLTPQSFRGNRSLAR